MAFDAPADLVLGHHLRDRKLVVLGRSWDSTRCLQILLCLLKTGLESLMDDIAARYLLARNLLQFVSDLILSEQLVVYKDHFVERPGIFQDTRSVSANVTKISESRGDVAVSYHWHVLAGWEAILCADGVQPAAR